MIRNFCFITVLALGCSKQNTDTSDTMDTSGTTETAVTINHCESTGMTERVFADVDDSSELYATAADFTVATTEGSYTLSEQWTGCGNVLVIPDQPQQATGWPKDLWQKKSDIADLLANLPDNTQVLFVSTEMGEDTRLEILGDLQGKVDDALKDIEESDDLESRIFYVTERARKLDGWLGEVFTSPNWGVGIDRFQRIRYIGSFADPTRYEADYGWFAPNLSMAANEAIYYNFESDRDDEMEALGATEIPLWQGDVISDPGWAGARGSIEIELPDAATMATYDTMEWELYLGCEGEGEYGYCPAWDYLVYLYLCDVDDPDSCSTEIGRWITTYHREGRWVHDVTGLLPLLADGGTRKFQFYSQQPYVVELTLRLANQGRELRPVSATPLYTGGSFNETYNDRFDEIEVEIPATAERVEIASVISGHGQVSPGTCAEFCVTTHHFWVNGDENVLSLDDAGSGYGCMEQVAEGTVPNQYGTWWYGRSNWCPGKEVELDTTDITAQVTAGETAVFDYEGYYQGSPYTTGGANIVMSSWVVVYE